MPKDATEVSAAPGDVRANLQETNRARVREGAVPPTAHPPPAVPQRLRLVRRTQSETLLRKRGPIRGRSPAEGEGSVSPPIRDASGLDSRPAQGGWAELHLAAWCHSAERRRPPPIGTRRGGRRPIGRGGRAGGLNLPPEPRPRGCVRSWVCARARLPPARREPGRDGDEGEGREDTVASLRGGGPV